MRTHRRTRVYPVLFFFSSRRRHTRFDCDWSSDVCSSDLTFGLKIANWFSENQRNIARFRDAAAQMAVGKISGAVGTASHLGTEIEERICKRSEERRVGKECRSRWSPDH